MLVHDMLSQTANRWPDKVGLVCRGQQFAYGQIDAMSNRLANALNHHGVKRGDRVAIHLPNCVEAVAGIFGVMKAGAAFVMLNPATKREKLCHILNHCRATALITEAATITGSEIGLGSPDVPTLRFVVSRSNKSGKSQPASAGCFDFGLIQDEFPADSLTYQGIDLDLACLIYTSGSTGEPKGVMCDHSNVVFVTESIVEYLRNEESDVVLSALPLAFSYGLYQLMAAVRAGARLILEDSFSFPVLVLQRMAKEGVTGFAGVPTLYALLLSFDLTPYDLSKLRYLTNAAAALPVDHVKRLRKQFPDTDLFLMHGLTEVARTVFLDPSQVDRRPDSVGKAIPGTEVWLEDEAGRRLGAGEIGELVVRGRHVMRGYWEDPEGTAIRFRPGPIPGERLCYSGDLFRMDDEGFLYFVSRKDDIIKSRGEKVAPREVENAIYSIAGVTEVAVIGVPDPLLGQAVKAFVVAPGRNLTGTEVMAYCKRHLEDFMVPKFVEFRDELPRTPSGKIRKVELH